MLFNLSKAEKYFVGELTDDRHLSSAWIEWTDTERHALERAKEVKKRNPKGKFVIGKKYE